MILYFFKIYSLFRVSSKIKHGAKCNIYKYRRGGEMYDNLERQFEQYWKTSIKVTNK